MFVSNELAKQTANIQAMNRASVQSRTENAQKASENSFADVALSAATKTQEVYTDQEIKSQQAHSKTFNLLSQSGNSDLADTLRLTATQSTQVQLACLDAAQETGSSLRKISASDGIPVMSVLSYSKTTAIDGHTAALGSSFSSAKAILKTAKYDVSHPTAGEYRADSSSYQREAELYDTIIEKLDALENGSLSYEDQDLFSRLKTNGQLGDENQAGIIQKITGTTSGTSDVLDTTTFSSNGSTVSMSASYAPQSTPQNPVVDVTVTKDGVTETYSVDVLSIDPDDISQIEGFALLCAANDPDYVEKDYIAGPQDIDTLSTSMCQSILGGGSTDDTSLSAYAFRTLSVENAWGLMGYSPYASQLFFGSDNQDSPEDLVFNELDRIFQNRSRKE